MTRIAQITDTHLRKAIPGHAAIQARRSREAPRLLEAALVDARQRGADVVVVTGDLLDVPADISEDDPAVEADYRFIRELLDSTEIPWLVVPGNHDAYEAMSRVFGAEPQIKELDGLRFVTFWDREHAGNVPRRVDAERQRFADVLSDPDDTPQVHLQHFVVTPALNEGYPHTYDDGVELRRATVASGRVRLSLSGHYHPGTELIHDDGTAFATGSAMAEAPHLYRMYVVADGPVQMESIAPVR